MINMMYLVLLALLALNVSAEILNAFVIIKNKLNVSAQNALANSNTFMNGMKEEIKDEMENEKKMKNAGLIDTLDIIKARTSKMIDELDRHIGIMGDSIAGRDPETGKLLSIDQTETNYQYWMGQGDEEEANDGRGSGKAFGLRNNLNDYAKFIVDIYNINLSDSARATGALKAEEEYIAVDPSTDITHGGEAKSWESFTFEGPVIANMATLEAIKLDVYEKEKKLLDLLNGRLGIATFKADKVIAINAPTATIVPAGLQFQTRLFVAMSSSQLKPRFNGSGSIEVEDGGNVAVMTVGANGGNIPKGKNEGVQNYSATISVPKATGGNEILKVDGSFTVRRPEIVITSAAVQNLYRNCGNDVNIDVPALGDQYNPKISATSATVIPSQKSKKKFRIVPTGKASVVTVSSITGGKTVKIGDVNYKVIKPPKPTINMAVNGKTYNGSSMVPKTSRVALRLEPDDDFKSALPQDARYGITSIDVLAQLSLGPPTKVNGVNANGQDATKAISVSLGTKVRQARAGTKVYIRINQIYRKNFQGKSIPDKRFSEVERTLSLVVK